MAQTQHSSSIDGPANEAASLLLRVGLSIIAIAVPVSTVLSRRAPFILLPVGAGIVLVAGLLLSDVPIRRRLAGALLSTAGFCGMAMIGWSALSLLWSPVGTLAVEKLAKTAGTIALVAATAAFLPERTRTSNLNLFPLGILAAVAVTLFVTLTQADAFAVQEPDSILERTVVTLVVLIWPALAAMAIRGRWIATVVVVIAVTLATMAAWSSLALTALALGSVGFVAATGNPVGGARLLGIVAAAMILLGPAMPFAIALALKPATALAGGQLPALQGATETARVWAELVVSDPVRLVTGHGIDMALVARSVGFLSPDAPRSLIFEIWYDFGVVGAVLTAVLVSCAFSIVGRLSPTVAPFLIAELVAMLAIGFSGLETTQIWWVTLGGVMGVAFSTVVRGEYRTTRPVARLEPQIAPLPR